MKKQHDILWRVYLSFFILCLLALAILVQIIHIQFFEGAKWKEKADAQTLKYETIPASRGNILSDDGSMLATSLPVYNLRMDFRAEGISNNSFDKSIDSLAICLAQLFPDKTRQDFKRELRKARIDGERYYLLRRGVRYSELQKIKSFPLFRLGRNKSGLIVEQESRRELSFDQLAARTLGTVRDVRPVGIEASFNSDLSGVSGKRLVQKIAGGVTIPVRDENQVEPKDGNDIVTTIDINIQDVAENSLEFHLREHNAHHGCAILMEVATGEIKAIANLTRDANGNYDETYNYAIGEATEPGSTFKAASLLAAFDDGLLTPDDSIFVGNGTRRYADQIMKDSHAPPSSRLTVQHAFEISSNVGISAAIVQAYQKNPDRFIAKLRSFGLNDKLSLQIEGEGDPRIKSPMDKDWSRVSLPWISIGYESRVTPLQTLTFYNAIANDGREMRPRIVREIRSHGKVIRSFPPEVMRDTLASPQAIHELKQLLEGVVLHGTGSHLKDSPYPIAGKTGTAIMYNGRSGYKIDDRKYQASFVGYFPADNPRYSCIVVVYGPSNDAYYGGAVAGPVFKEIADKVYANHLELHDRPFNPDTSLNVIPLVKAGLGSETREVVEALGLPLNSKNSDATWVTQVTSDDEIVLGERNVNGALIPNVTGMGISDALFLLENKGLEVKVSGRGIVRSQTPAAGNTFQRGQTVTIELN